MILCSKQNNQKRNNRHWSVLNYQISEDHEIMQESTSTLLLDLVNSCFLSSWQHGLCWNVHLPKIMKLIQISDSTLSRTDSFSASFQIGARRFFEFSYFRGSLKHARNLFNSPLGPLGKFRRSWNQRQDSSPRLTSHLIISCIFSGWPRRMVWILNIRKNKFSLSVAPDRLSYNIWRQWNQCKYTHRIAART